MTAKRKLLYVFGIILLIGGLFFAELRLRATYGYATPFNSWTAKQDMKRGIIRIVEIGELPLNFQQKQELAKSYGFRYYLYGCVVTEAELSGIKRYNKIMFDYLEHKHGKGWQKTFQAQLDGSLDKVVELVFEEEIVKELIDSLSDSQLYNSITPTLVDTTNNIYLVRMYNMGFLVDANAMKVIRREY